MKPNAMLDKLTRNSFTVSPAIKKYLEVGTQNVGTFTKYNW